jgi:hypothetical protein
MCDEQAAKKYNESGHGGLDNYTSHYDPAVNVCYVRVHSIAEKPVIVISNVVYDAFGGRLYANYSFVGTLNNEQPGTLTCEIHIPNKPVEKCKSADDFDALAEKYFGVTQ